MLIFTLFKDQLCCKVHIVKLQSPQKASQTSLFSARPHLPIWVQTEPSHQRRHKESGHLSKLHTFAICQCILNY